MIVYSLYVIHEVNRYYEIVCDIFGLCVVVEFVSTEMSWKMTIVAVGRGYPF